MLPWRFHRSFHGSLHELPPKMQIVQVAQCSSTYSSTPGMRGAVIWLVLEDLVRNRKQTGGLSIFVDTRPSRRASEPPSTTHPPPNTHPPPTIHPRTYPLLQYSNAAVRRAIHLTGEQQSIRWLQCSRVQQSHCSSIFHRVLLTRALALSASQFVRKKKSPTRIYTSMHSGGFELTKLTYTMLEGILIRHRG